MKIMLVTGGAGFKGSSFIKHFLKRNRNFIVVNIDKQTYPYAMNRLDELENSPRYHHIKGDVCNRDLTEYVLHKYRPSWIVNFCREPQSSADPRKFQAADETSFTSTLTLLEGARNIWARSSFTDKRFVQISTDDVYGLSPAEKDLHDENAALLPDNPYSALKAGADLMALAYFRAFALPVNILRSCNTYGPWQDPHCTVPTLIKKVLADEPISFHSTGSAKEWIYISDLCSAITRTLFFSRPGEIYNAGSGETATEADIAALLLKLAGKPADRLPVYGNDKKTVRICRISSSKARYNLKWVSSYSLADGLRDTVSWYEKHSSKSN